MTTFDNLTASVMVRGGPFWIWISYFHSGFTDPTGSWNIGDRDSLRYAISAGPSALLVIPIGRQKSYYMVSTAFENPKCTTFKDIKDIFDFLQDFVENF